MAVLWQETPISQAQVLFGTKNDLTLMEPKLSVPVQLEQSNVRSSFNSPCARLQGGVPLKIAVITLPDVFTEVGTQVFIPFERRM